MASQLSQPRVQAPLAVQRRVSSCMAVWPSVLTHQQHRRAASGGNRDALLVPKPEVKEENDKEAAQATKVAEYFRQQRLIASSDDSEDYPRYNAAFMASLNHKEAWMGNVADVIAESFRDSGRPLVDLTRDEEGGPSGTVKDEHADEDADPHGKAVIDESMYNFRQYYDPSGRRKFY